MKKPLLICLPLLLGGCAIFQSPQPSAVEQTSVIHGGMAPDTVRRLLGNPDRTEMAGGNTVWHYCKPYPQYHEFTAVVYYNDRVIAVRPYTVARNPDDKDCASRMRPMLNPPK